MNRKFPGPMGSLIKRYLKLRDSLGRIIVTAKQHLFCFDRYLSKHFPNTKVITREIIIDYLQTIRHLHSTTLHAHISSLRQFCRFLFQFNTNTYIPERSLVPSAKVKIKPYIYTMKEVQKLTRLAKQIRPINSLQPHTYAAIIGLLWVSGLRIGEVVRLNLKDVDLDEGLLYIRQTKFHKSRIVPISKSAVVALVKYRKRRNSWCYDNSNTEPFFINLQAKRYRTKTIQRHFLKLTKQLGLKTLQGKTPRLHDFRHTFATRWLTEFYQSGKDPTAYLPILATFLGHVNVSNTQLYLHPSLDLLNSAGEMFRQYINVNRRLK